jgi:hypothetical protein
MSDPVDLTPSRELFRRLRTQPVEAPPPTGEMPESALWRAYCELRRRKAEGCGDAFLTAMKAVHGRRVLGVQSIGRDDGDPGDHRFVDDAYLGELWRAYKRCIRQGRPGPACQFLRDLERSIGEE